jgi:RNA polymerase sigma factor (sigma-70 family)
MGFISHVQYDANGTPVPVPMPTTTTRNHSNKFGSIINSRSWLCNSDPYRLLSYTVSPQNDVLPPGTPLQRSPQLFPRVHPEWNTGSHKTHLLNSTDEMVEYRAPFLPLLTQMLAEQGFTEQTTTVLLSDRSAIRKAGDSWTAPKISANAINQVHALFADDELSPEDYSTQLAALLDPNGGADTFGFLASIADSLETNTYSTRSKFGAKLKEAFIAFRDDGKDVGADDSEDEEQGQHGAIPAPVVEVGSNRAAVEEAHAGYIQRNCRFHGASLPLTVSEDRFLITVRKFTKGRVGWKFRGTDQFGQTEEDLVQITMVKMWDALPTFKGTSGDFVAWYRTFIDNTVKDAIRGSIKQSKRHAPFYVQVEDEKGNSEEIEHPGIHGSIEFKRNGHPAYQEARIQFRRELPDFIQGVDLQICQYIREDYTYERIAQILGLTVNAVKKRIQKMFNRIQEMKAAGEL